MELSEALNNRKSTRHYIDKKVDKSLLDEMLSAANLAPSWKNSQTPRFYVATGEKSKNAVREALPEFNRKNSENASAALSLICRQRKLLMKSFPQVCMHRQE